MEPAGGLLLAALLTFLYQQGKSSGSTQSGSWGRTTPLPLLELRSDSALRNNTCVLGNVGAHILVQKGVNCVSMVMKS